MSTQLLVINIAGLGATAVGPHTPRLQRFARSGSGVVALQPPVPALTSPSQASLLTGTTPAMHGIVSNGWYFRDLALVLNWQRSANLVGGQAIWEAVRAKRPQLQCANLFWRFATHSTTNLHMAERPTYWADGRKSPDIYVEPERVRTELVQRLGPFPLFRFWGPAAGMESTRWIVDATIHVLRQEQHDLVLTYLPHLDYDHQRYGPASEQGLQALRDVDAEAGRLMQVALEQRMRVAVVSDYAFEPVSRPVFLNRALRQAGLVRVQRAENGELLEPGASAAFAVCDQQTAHVYVQDQDQLARVRSLLEDVEGVEQVLDRGQMGPLGLDHPRSGELFAIARPDCWFAYPYWLDDREAPDFARCVAIHAKPGWDPSELFLRPGLRGRLHLAKRLLQKICGLRAPFDVISGDMSLVRGAHGRIPVSDETRAVLMTSWSIPAEAVSRSEDVKAVLVQCLTE